MRIRHYLTTLCLAAPLCLAETADTDSDYDAESVAADEIEYEEDYNEDYNEVYNEVYGEDYEEEEDRTYTEEEMEAALKTFTELNTKMTEVLKGVKDLATADAAAPAYVALEKELEDKKLANILMAIMQKKGFSVLMEGISARRKSADELQKVFFYGSVALAEAVTGDASDAMAPQPMTDDVRQAIIQNMNYGEDEDNNEMVVHIGLSGDSNLVESGGPGFTRETAWVSSAKDRSTADFHTGLIMSRKYEECNIADKKEVKHEGHVYHVVTADFVHENIKYRADVWVDVTAGYKTYTPEQQQAALEKLAATLQEISDILRGIKDKATADAAAEKLQELYKSCTSPELIDILMSMDREKVREAMKAAAPSEEEMEAIRQRLKENDYYGSEKLKEL